MPFKGGRSKAGVIFCHVPKNAGSKITLALYGRRLGHIRLSQLIRANKKQLPILAVWRGTIERFLSASAYARGGGELVELSLMPSCTEE